MVIDGVFNVDRLHTSIITIGRRGENLATTIPIDVSAWLEQWPDASIDLLIVRPGDTSAYVAKTRLEDGTLLWPVTKADTDRVGHGTFEVRAIAGEVVKKSIVARFKVCPCISCTGDPEPPETARDWVNDVLSAAVRAEEAVERAEEIVDALAGGGGNTGSSLFLPSVSEKDDGKVLTVVGGDWVAAELPKYNGAYEVTPLAGEATTLETAQKFMTSDVTVKQIPFFDVTNERGGSTVYIGVIEEDETTAALGTAVLGKMVLA